MILDWAAAEGWNPGLDDAGAFYQTDPEGFFLKRINGRPIAAISVVNHSHQFAFLGLYICKPEFRGQGHGLSLWTEALTHSGGRTVGLDGVPDQQTNYRASGFEPAGQTFRYQGAFTALAGVSSARALRSDEIPTLMNRDRQQVGFDRAVFLSAWLKDTETRRTLVVEQSGTIAGYATLRACREGYKIGPFSAESETVASNLLAGCAGIAGNGASVMVDVPDSRPALSNLLTAANFTVGFNTARMYRGAPPKSKLSLFTCVATLELG